MLSLPAYALVVLLGLCALGLVNWRQFLDEPPVEVPVEVEDDRK